MILIIGGYAQGKRKYAKEKYPDRPLSENLAELFRESSGAEKEVRDFISDNPDAVIISDEVGSGVVPMEKSERDYRERLGRFLCELASEAESVERVFCGIGARIK